MDYPTPAGIRLLREQAGMDAATLAGRLNLTLDHYQAMEAGHLPVSLRTWCQMQSLRYEFRYQDMAQRTAA